MSIKVSNYIPINGSFHTSDKQTTITDIPEENSFKKVLVLNQSALKAMTIDHMIANSETGSIDPDAVNAKAIMEFRSTLKNVEAPIPVEDEPIKVPTAYTPANTITNKPHSTTPIVNSSTINNPMYQTGSSTDDSILNLLLQTVDTSDVYNEGELYCSNTLNTYFKAASEKYNVDVKLLKAMAKAESDFNPYDTSKSGAMGIMQLMPATARHYGVENPYNAYENIMGGAHLMADNLGRFNGDITKAVAAYNCGGKPVEEANGVPEIEQTQKYVANVLKYYNYS